MAAPLLSPFETWAQDDKLKNWAGNLEYSTNKIDYAASVEDVQQIVKKYSKLKVLGTKHCFQHDR
jgi:xylitol oxidase